MLENTLDESLKLKNMSGERLVCLTKSLLSYNFYRVMSDLLKIFILCPERLPPLGEKGPYDFTTVSMSVGKHVFSKTAHMIFLKLPMKLGYLKAEKLTELEFWEKISFWGQCPKYPENRVFGILQKY